MGSRLQGKIANINGVAGRSNKKPRDAGAT